MGGYRVSLFFLSRECAVFGLPLAVEVRGEVFSAILVFCGGRGERGERDREGEKSDGLAT